MPSATPLGFEQQDDGSNANIWGDHLNVVITLVDEALRGIYTATLSGSHTLDATNFVSNEARRAILNITGGSGGTLIIPDISKTYIVINGAAGDVTVRGSGTGAAIHSGEICQVVSDGTTVKRVVPTDFGSATLTGITQAIIANSPTLASHIATKAYADALAFASFAGTFPAQGGNAGKFTKTDGAAVSWQYAVDTGAGLAVVVNDTVTVTAGAAADVRTGTDTTKALTSAAVAGSAAFITLTDATTVAWDASAGYNAEVTLGGNRVIGAPTNLVDGQTYTLDLIQDSTGTRIPTWNAIWDFGAAGTPVLQTAVGKRDKVVAQYRSSTTKLYASFRKGA